MIRRRLGALLLTTPLFAACAFLMDFDELQKGNGGASGKGGSSGSSTGGAASPDASAGASGSGGAGGAGGDTDASGNCPTGCADTDPCTVDACTATGCTHAYTAGVYLDGLSDKATAPAVHRVTVTAQKPSFYLSALVSTATGSDVMFYGLNATDTKLSAARELSKLGSFNGRMPVSAAGIAATTNGLVLNVFVAMGQAIGQPAQVWELTVDPSLGVRSSGPAAADDNYGAPPTAYPVAWSPSGADVFAAWPGATSGVFLHRAGDPAAGAGTSPTFAAPGGKVTQVAPLSAGAVPGALFVNTKASIQAVGQLFPISLGACDANPGALTSAFTAHSLVDGVWLGGWTKTKNAGGWVSELKPLLCGASSSGVGCLGGISCQADDAAYDGIRNPAIVFVSTPSDPVGRVYEIIALPYVNAQDNEAGIGLQMHQVDVDISTPDASARAKPITPSPVPIVRVPPGANNTGPDLPAMAFLEPDHLAIAWIQPAASGQELHVERHKVCFPK